MVQPLRSNSTSSFLTKFQYILCYGSTDAVLSLPTIFRNFNTSYVMVQPSKNYISALGRSDFNTSYVMVQQPRTSTQSLIIEFQYILCYGSTLINFGASLSIGTFQYILCYGSTD